MNDRVLIHFLRHRHNAAQFDVDSFPWETLIRQARLANLLSRVAVFVQDMGLLETLPDKPRQHLLNAIQLSDANARSSRWEVQDIYRVLHAEAVDVLLLKGSAYIWSGNNACKGRLFGDTDILVRRGQLKQAERILVHSGWVTTKIDNYDQKYYRTWSHELPPLHHTGRHTSLDVHHSILPPIIRSRFDVDRLWRDAVEDQQHKGLFTLSLQDMILHSATHLFHEGEFPNGLRDISDLDQLIVQFNLEVDDWDSLLRRADELDLSAYLYYALHYCSVLLQTPIPRQVIKRASRNSSFGPLHNWMMEKLFIRALLPNHVTAPVFASSLCRWLLFIRGHYIRMPLRVLIPHLLFKTRGSGGRH